MKDSRDDQTSASHLGLHGQKPALQVICLGSSGGPSEENVTAFLVRSTGSEWARNSLLAVDAGSHLAPITRILERDFPNISGYHTRKHSNGSHLSNGNGQSKSLVRASLSPTPSLPDEEPPKPEPTVLTDGPFAGLKLPNESARANALHVLRSYVSTYLITHPHLDHLSGFAINTAAFHATSRPKTLAALPSTVNAIKDHIFNDVIWPNLTDEDGGVGFVTFQRLKEGGDLMVGEGEGRGYIDVCDGLGVKAFKVSHGTCTKSPPSHLHRTSTAGIADSQPLYNGSISGSAQDLSAPPMNRSMSISHHSQPGTPGQRQSFHGNHPSPHLAPVGEASCVVDSTAFFLRDEFTQREVLIFGDVEPDLISVDPRNFVIWKEAARKIAHGVLGGIFIECSYDDSQADALLFGHLCPRHLIAELQELARYTIETKQAVKAEKASRKRKRSAGPNGLDSFARHALSETERKRSRSVAHRPLQLEDKRRSSAPDDSLLELLSHPPPVSTPPVATEEMSQYDFPDGLTHAIEPITSPKSGVLPPPSNIDGDATQPPEDMPLNGIRIIVIHVKDTLKDGPPVSDNILAELLGYEKRLREAGQGLGCEFVISQSGESYWF